MQKLAHDDRHRISVMIPTYNYAHYLPRAIESVLAQTLPVHEIIVADDGSTDNTETIVGQYAKVKYRRFEHAGVYALRNAILPEIEGEWYLNLDADNWLDSAFIEHMSLALSRHRDSSDSIAFLYPNMMMHGASVGLNQRPEFDVQRLKTGNYLDMNALICTSVAQRFGFDPAFNSGQGDYDFFLTLVENGYKGARVPEAILHYDAHEDSLSRTASRRRRQLEIMHRIVRKHRSFFSQAESRKALHAAANRVMVSLINGRSPYAGLRSRARDLLAFLRVGWRHAELRNQVIYTLRPKCCFVNRQASPSVFFLYRDTGQRREALRQVTSGKKGFGGREQLMGYDSLCAQGVSVEHNLNYNRVPALVDHYLDWRDRRYAQRVGFGLGDQRMVSVHLPQMNQAKCVLATSDAVGLPALKALSDGRLVRPLVYVSIGMPERLERLRAIAPQLEDVYRERFLRVSRVIAHGYEEAQWLDSWLEHRVPVSLLPFGVDTDFWQPSLKPSSYRYDTISVGSDVMRDFDLYIAYAYSHPELRCGLVVGRHYAAHVGAECPSNLSIHVDISVEAVRDLLERSRVVVLPVKENTYSGATTTLLQAMALGRPVAVSRVGAIREGYGFNGDHHLCWMTPEREDVFFEVVDRMLDDDAFSSSIGVHGRQHVLENLTWGRFVERLEKLLPLEGNVT